MSDATAPLWLYQQIDTPEAGKFLGVSSRRMEKYRSEGNGPKFVRCSPKLIRYRYKDLIDFQETNLKENTI